MKKILSVICALFLTAMVGIQGMVSAFAADDKEFNSVAFTFVQPDKFIAGEAVPTGLRLEVVDTVTFAQPTATIVMEEKLANGWATKTGVLEAGKTYRFRINVEKLKLNAYGHFSNTPLSVTINGIPVEAKDIADFKKNGSIEVSFTIFSGEFLIKKENTQQEQSVIVFNGTAYIGDRIVDKAKKDEVVKIIAEDPAEGMEFDKWVVLSKNVQLADDKMVTTTFTMPDQGVTIEASYKKSVVPTQEYKIHVIGGKALKIGGKETTTAAENEIITLKANPAAEGKVFDHWQVNKGDVEIVDETADYTGFDMPAEDVEIEAVYVDAPVVPEKEYSITVESGTAFKLGTSVVVNQAKKGADIQIEADEAPEGYVFDRWVAVSGDVVFAEADEAITGFEMPAADVKVKATYKTVSAQQTHSISYDLNGGTLNGKTGVITITAKNGDTITIPDAPIREGYEFMYWKGSRYYPGDSYVVAGDHTFVAQWEKITKKPDVMNNGNSAAQTEKKSTPKTEDGTNLMLYIGMMCVSLLAVIAGHKKYRSYSNQ